MIKILTVLALMMTLSFARMIGGVSMTVDNEPITLAEIRAFQKQNKISKEDAVNALIQRKLEEQVIKEYGIYVNPYDVEKEAELFAKKNGVDIAGLKEGLTKQGISFEKFKADLTEKLKRDKLYKKILAGRMKRPDDATLKAYYETHKDAFKLPGNIKVIEYSAKDGKALQMLQMAPMMNHPNVKMKEKTIEAAKVNPKLFALLLQTPETTFTQIINTGDGFVTFFIKEKGKDKVISFEQAKQNIIARVMKEKEQALLIEFFEKRKSEAIIKVIRRP
jgi:DNA-binding Lrp family transcriptional regulator